MKKTGFFLIAITMLLMHGCSSSRHIVSKTITHRHYNLSFTPEEIQKTVLGNLSISITPIDAASLNQMTFEAASLDGNYEKELATAITNRRLELNKLSRQDRRDAENMLIAIDEIIKMQEAYLISSLTAYKLKMRIWHGKEYGKDGTEVTSLLSQERFSDIFNPFKVNQNFLSVFRVTLENKGSQIYRLKVSDFQIISGEELLHPLNMGFFESTLEGEQEKTQNAYRLNMPDELVLTPHQRITKYIATPAINPHNENLTIQLITELGAYNFAFIVNEEPTFRQYFVEKYNIVTPNRGKHKHHLFYAISYENGISYATIDNYFYASPDQKNMPLTFLYVAALRKDRKGAEVKRLVVNRLSEHKRNNITVRF